jgi:hypothetical protein
MTKAYIVFYDQSMLHILFVEVDARADTYCERKRSENRTTTDKEVAMRVDVRRRGVEIDAREQSNIERRLAFALGRFGPRVLQVTVFLTDENGPKGGLDKRCRLVARLSQLGVITVDDRDAELTPLMDRSTDRLERAIERAIERRRVSASRRDAQQMDPR